MKLLRGRSDGAAANLADVVGRVRDAELGHSVADLGMLGDIGLDRHGRARVSLRLASNASRSREQLSRDVGAALAECAGVRGVEITFEPMDPAGRQRVSRLLRSGSSFGKFGDDTAVYAVASGKGGVGKSSITVNLAATLAADGRRVGLIDADVWGYSIPTLFGVSRPPVAVDGVMLPVRAHGVQLMSVGFFVHQDEPVVWRGPMLHKALEQFVRDVYWGPLDLLLLDLPPGTGDVALSLMELLPTMQLLLVTTPQAAARTVALRAGLMAKNARVPVAGVIENMSATTCPGCGAATPVFGRGGGAQLARELGVALLGEVPLDQPIQDSGDSGVPAVLSDPDSPAATELTRIAHHLPRVRRTLTGRQLPLYVTSDAERRQSAHAADRPCGSHADA